MSDFPGYKRLQTPVELLAIPAGEAAPAVPVRDVASYQLWHRHHVERRGGQVWDSERSAVARVEHGRWVITCVWCETSALTHPEWRVAYCGECGARYDEDHLVLPDDPGPITDALLVRPARENQNWLPGETVEDLERQNAEHGVEA